MSKPVIAVLFGGQSSEHIVSCMSAANIIERINKEKYQLLLIGITQEGKWLKAEDLKSVKDGSWQYGKVRAAISPDAEEKCVLLMDGGQVEKVKIDLVFPVLHGLYGEDGTIQGLLELAQIPYVGCGVLASAVSMDKWSTKIIADHLDICQAEFEPVWRSQVEENLGEVLDRIEKRFSYPVFVKPSNAGSSRGVTKAENREQLKAGLLEAARHDRKILVEEMIYGREVECAVFGGGTEPVIASGVGEILAAADFYDFDAKYFNEESRTVTDPELPGEATETIRKTAVKIFQAVDGYGLARVDFFVKENGPEEFPRRNWWSD